MENMNPALVRNPKYSEMSFTLAAGEEISLAMDGDFVACLDADQGFRIGFNEGPKAGFEKGLKFRTEQQFRSVQLYNQNGAAIAVRIAFGRGDIEDARLNLTGSITARDDTPDTLTTGAATSCATGAATLLAAANDLRREIVVVVPDSAGGTVYVGGASGATAGEGIPVSPGGTLILTTSAAVYLRNDTGAAVAVAVAEMEHST